jgi:hypothetical protein
MFSSFGFVIVDLHMVGVLLWASNSFPVVFLAGNMKKKTLKKYLEQGLPSPAFSPLECSLLTTYC